jgi:hypothetical protein
MNYRSTGSQASAILCLAVFALAGCAGEDKRLAEDKQSCVAMGHSPGTPTFEQCLQDLNERRCAMSAKKGQTSHVATRDCSRI